MRFPNRFYLLAVLFLVLPALSVTTTAATTDARGLVGTVRTVSPAAVPDARPNFIVITTDDMRADDIRHMPRTRKLIGGKGLTFTRAYTPLALCCPNRATFLTGQHAHNHHVMGNTAAQGGGYGAFKHRSKPRNTLAPWLKAAGYRTGFAGKFMNRYGDRNMREVPPGWTDWRATPGIQSFDFTNQLWNINGKLRRISGHNTRVVTSQALMTMRPGPKPWFTWLNYVAPHQEWRGGGLWAPPSPLKADRNAKVNVGAPNLEKDLSDKSTWFRRQPGITGSKLRALNHLRVRRARSLVSVDRQVARIVRYLRRSGQLDNTVLVFTSDNGFALGEHGVQYGKTYPHEVATKVPLLISGPGIPQGSTRSMVATYDITATLVDLAEAKARRVMDGISLTKIMASPASFSDRPMLYESGPVLGYPIIASIKRGRQFYAAIHSGDWTYIRYFDGQQELYNLSRDPGQKQSLHKVERFAGIKRQLAAKLSKLRDCRGRECNTPFQLK